MSGETGMERKRDRLKAQAKRYMTVPFAVRTSDLPVRLASAAVMMAVAGGALWAGGDILTAFIALVALACFVEFCLLVFRATPNPSYRFAGTIGGAFYIGVATFFLANEQAWDIVAIVGAVICVDVFAYFFGRTLGGPKIAPSISPSKTWAGLLGGVVGASLFFSLYGYLAPSVCELLTAPGMVTDSASQFTFDSRCHFGPNPDFGQHLLSALFAGLLVAPIAQAGDFFESWLKRRAHKKDSSNLIPGHGGVFDRVDGLLAVSLFAGLFGMFG